MIELIHSHTFRTSKPGDVGHDLYVIVHDHEQTFLERLVSAMVGVPSYIIWPFGQKAIPSGIFMSQPNDVWCWITARSSAARRGLHVFTGIIDSGYQGELFAVLRNLTLRPQIIKDGDRYAQAIFLPAVRPEFTTVDQFLVRSVRADSGFGSTGR